MNSTDQDLDRLIEQEKRHAAREVHEEAWADGLLEGIDGVFLAEAAIMRALEETVSLKGEDGAIKLLDQLRDRVLVGDFTAGRIVQ